MTAAGLHKVIYQSRRVEIWSLHGGGLVLAFPSQTTDGDPAHVLEILPGDFEYVVGVAEEKVS